jgi:hypothetical protein
LFSTQFHSEMHGPYNIKKMYKTFGGVGGSSVASAHTTHKLGNRHNFNTALIINISTMRNSRLGQINLPFMENMFIT